jgi:aminobenzoyl-glutamate utilization protein B
MGAQPQEDAQTSTPHKIAATWVDDHQMRIVEVSDAIWGYAEPSFEEFRSYTLLAGELRKAGFELQEGVATMPTAFVATFSQGSGKPVIGIVAEYDTPTMAGLSQKAGVPYRAELSHGDYGHGCGHNMIAASSAAAAIAIKEAMVQTGLSGTIKFFGTPAEEELTGKVYMVDAGLFKDVDAALAWHPGPNFEARYGVNNAMHRVKLIFRGKTADQTLKTVRMFQERAKQENAALTLRGGTVEARVSVSAPTFQESEGRLAEVRKVAAQVAAEMNTELEDHLVVGTYQRLTNEGLVTLMNAAMRQFAPLTYTPEEIEFAKQMSKTFDKPPSDEQLMPRLLPPSKSVGSMNDNADVSWVTPFISVRGGTYVNGVESHTWQQTSLASSSIGHKGLVAMAKVVSTAALDLMTKPAVLAGIRKEFEEKTAGFTYRAALPKDRNWRWVRR